MPGKGSDICGIPAFASEVSLLHNGHGGIMKSHPELLDWPQHQLRFWGMGDASEKELGAVPKRCPAPSLGTTKYICSPKWLISCQGITQILQTHGLLLRKLDPQGAAWRQMDAHLSICLSVCPPPCTQPWHPGISQQGSHL